MPLYNLVLTYRAAAKIWNIIDIDTSRGLNLKLMLYSLVGKIEYSLFNDVGCSYPTATAVYYRKYQF